MTPRDAPVDAAGRVTRLLSATPDRGQVEAVLRMLGVVPPPKPAVRKRPRRAL